MHKGDTEKLDVCIIVTSDSVALGLKEDQLRNSIPQQFAKQVARYEVIPNSLPILVNLIRSCIETCNVVIVTGGTGVSEHDVSIRAINAFEGVELDQLGDLFRYASYREIGVRAFASRTTAKLIRYPKPSIVLAVPGKTEAVKLALKILLEDLVPHIIYEARKRSCV